jgi:hypothetical protein
MFVGKDNPQKMGMKFLIDDCSCLRLRRRPPQAGAGTATQVGSAEEWNPKRIEFII